MMSNPRMGAIALAMVLLAAGCGGAATQAPTDDGSGDGSGATPAPTVDQGNGSAETPAPVNPGAAEDAAKTGEQLAPPNSTETSRTTTAGYWWASYESTDSPDALKSYYEGQIPKVGLQIISTSTASGSYVWAVARDESGSFGGGITVAPSGNGSGSSVIIAIGSE